MITYPPRDARMPAINAAPYPRRGTSTTTAPSSRAMSWDPSIDPLSATTTSPTTPSVAKERVALRMHAARVSASLRQGRTTDSSTTAEVGDPAAVLAVCGAADDRSGIGAAALGAVEVVSLGTGAAEVVALGVDEPGVVALEDVMTVGSFPCGPTRPVRARQGSQRTASLR